MNTSKLLEYYLVWSVVGCSIFNVFVIIVFRSGIVWEARDKGGTLKRDIPLRGYLTMLVIPFGIIALQVMSNILSLRRVGISLEFMRLWLLNFGYYLILLVYDTLVIDYFVLLIWRPNFLAIPEDLNQGSMKKHFYASIWVGLGAGFILTTLGTLISFFYIFRS